jgi:hypothetical protein
MSLRCSVCGESFLSTGRWREEWCTDCWAFNFKDAQELRVHEDVPLTPRQQDAMLRLAVAQAREDEHQRYAADCRAALQQLLAQEE